MNEQTARTAPISLADETYANTPVRYQQRVAHRAESGGLYAASASMTSVPDMERADRRGVVWSMVFMMMVVGIGVIVAALSVV